MAHLKRSFIIIVLFAGLGILFYPAISNWLAVKNHSKAIQVYNVTVEQLTEIEIERQLELAEAYHVSYMNTGIIDPFAANATPSLPENYTSVLNINGIMGYIEIPAINVYLPIYHSTSDEVLKKGVGHLATTAFPIGKTGGHPVLTAHRGLPSSKLFTDLNLLNEKDIFLLHILDKVYAYEVDQVLTVEPHETEALVPVFDKDYVTLVTCTPYAINSHRLLVRGTRIQYETSTMENVAESEVYNYIHVWIALSFVLIGIIFITVLWKKSKFKKNQS